VLLRVEGEALNSPIDLLPHLEEGRVGSALRLTILRAGEIREIQAVVGESERGRA
jgi:hypothetical protein